MVWKKQPPLCAIDHFIILVGKPEYGCPTRDGCFFVVVVCLFFGQWLLLWLPMPKLRWQIRQHSHNHMQNYLGMSVGPKPSPNTEFVKKFLLGSLMYCAIVVPEKWGLSILKRAEFAKSFSLKGVVFTNCHFWQSVFATDIVIVWNGVRGRNSWESLNSAISL